MGKIVRQSKGRKRVMKMMSIKQRLDALEAALGQFCPRCTVSEAMTEEERNARIQAILSGQGLQADLPEPSPSCQRCQKAADMSEEEIDAELARHSDMLQRCGYAGLNL